MLSYNLTTPQVLFVRHGADNTAITSPCTRFAGQDTAPELGVGRAHLT